MSVKDAFNRFFDRVLKSETHTYVETKKTLDGRGHLHVERVKKTGSEAKKEIEKMREEARRYFGI